MAKRKTTVKGKSKKIFVLDTSVILYDSNAIKNFEENDIAIPIQVLEELDNFKKGNETVNFEAREFIRFVDEISKEKLINDWVPLNGRTTGNFKVILHSQNSAINSETVFDDSKYDNKILDCALTLKEENPEKSVILVSKDICLRLKAKALNLTAEDYETGKVKDVRTIDKRHIQIDGANEDLIDKLFAAGIGDPEYLKRKKLYANQYFILKHRKKSVLAYYNREESILERVKDQEAYGIKALNAEQSFALNALMNPSIKLVTIQGMAGTGKTLLALAAALEQRSSYRQIFVSRPVIPLSNRDLGYLPGDVKSKLDPYMQSLWDNLNFIKGQFKPTDRNYKRIETMLETEKIAISPLAYIRGRSLVKIFFIIDEAQNLTPHEIKTIISRAGDDTKIVFTGDIHQIDTPYLDAQSNGLSYLIDKVKDHPIAAHIALQKGERSELANVANEYL
ncbi:MAG TPA: PhoH family protein [Cryomorphaceae bacterium]|nr:PhoH family protein [Cryomorphaceae bacterium]